MAELLIYDTDHWMDALKKTEIDAYNAQDPRFQSMYDRRLQRGDIMKVYPDGWFDTRGFDQEVYAVVKIPGTPVDHPILVGITERLLEPNPDPSIKKILKRRRFRLKKNLTEKIIILDDLDQFDKEEKELN